jgi:hypothetical protein
MIERSLALCSRCEWLVEHPEADALRHDLNRPGAPAHGAVAPATPNG